jgi:uncharacterized membrane protein YkgB
MLRGGLIGNTSKTNQDDLAGGIGKAVGISLRNLDRRAVEIVSSHYPNLVRASLAIVFVWFGLLKIIGHSPVTDLVVQTMQWLHAPSGLLIIILGILEIALGLGLLFGRGAVLRVTLFIFLLHLSGTLLVLAQTDVAFQRGNPLLLTTEGEFVVKNLVLITAGLVLLGSSRRSESDAVSTGK